MTSGIHILEDDHFHDHCGVFGVFGHPEAAKLAYLGIYALQHRGQESAGIASADGNDLHIYKSLGHVQEIFTPEAMAQSARLRCDRAHALFHRGRQRPHQRAAHRD